MSEFSCGACGKAFPKLYDVKKHRAEAHPQAKKRARRAPITPPQPRAGGR